MLCSFLIRVAQVLLPQSFNWICLTAWPRGTTRAPRRKKNKSKERGLTSEELENTENWYMTDQIKGTTRCLAPSIMEHWSKTLSAGLILSLSWLRKPDIFLLGAFLDIFYSSSMNLTVTGSVVLILTLEEQSHKWWHRDRDELQVDVDIPYPILVLLSHQTRSQADQ